MQIFNHVATGGHKRSVVRTLLHRAEHLVSEEVDKAKEVQHIQNALLANCYKRWMFKVPSRPSLTSQGNSTSETTRPISLGLPYVSGLSEHLSRVFRAQDIRTYHKPYNTLRSILGVGWRKPASLRNLAKKIDQRSCYLQEIIPRVVPPDIPLSFYIPLPYVTPPFYCQRLKSV